MYRDQHAEPQVDPKQCDERKKREFDPTMRMLHECIAEAEKDKATDKYTEDRLRELLQGHELAFCENDHPVHWELRLGDFPALLEQVFAGSTHHPVPAPHLILFDAYSPATNPAMWTLPLFINLFRLLDPAKPCVMPTYSRSTMLRVTLLLAGFHVGTGHATGEKEETTIAANIPELIDEPLDRNWLRRVRRSTSAEPLGDPVYRQAPVSPGTWERLQAHPQFR